jgi:hypothetical protein
MPNLGKAVKGSAKVDDPLSVEQDVVRQSEQRRKQEVLLCARLEELMNEEQTMARTSLRQIQQRWLTVLRAQKTKELRAEIEVVRHTFEKTLDRKNAVIHMLSIDLAEAEEQYRLALRTHLGNVDSLIDLQNRRMSDLDQQFEYDLINLKREFELERAEIQRRHELEKADLRLILENMKAEAEREDRKLQEETSESHDTAIEKMDEEKKQMQNELIKITDGLRSQISQQYSEFNTSAELHLKEYTDLTRADEKSAKEIEGQMRKIQKLQESISTWKSNLTNNIRECEERNSAMKAEKETIARHFKELKLKMQHWRTAEEKRLAQLVTSARSTKQDLTSKGEQAERVLRLVELCGALETERERVLRFDTDVSTQEVQADVASRVKKYVEHKAMAGDRGPSDIVTMEQLLALEDDSDLSASAAEEWKLMERFWLRYNKVVLDVAAIEQEQFHLNNENQKLRNLLKQYLDGISVNHEVMATRNNLLQATKLKGMTAEEAKGQSRSNVPVIEGKKVISEATKQRVF